METPADPVALAPTGMSCSHCVRAVREALEGVEGVRVHDVSVGEAHVSAAAPAVWGEVEPRIRAALDEAGYPLAS